MFSDIATIEADGLQENETDFFNFCNYTSVEHIFNQLNDWQSNGSISKDIFQKMENMTYLIPTKALLKK